MALLNIHQFTERVEKSVIYCPKCRGSMKPMALRWKDLCVALVNSNRIMERFQCSDCRFEIRVDKKV